jgi:O-antigen/teichoic acid export membrane protein
MTAARRDALALTAGSVVSGLLAYLLFALVTRGIGAAAAAPVSVLWTLWALVSAAFTFPLQHWITHSVVAGNEAEVRRAAGRVATVVIAATLATGGATWLLRERLFHRDDAWFPVLVMLVTLGSAAVGVVRGTWGGRRRFVAVAWSLVAENGLRCVLVIGLLLGDVHDPAFHGLALAAGGLVALVPSGWTLTDTGEGRGGALAFLGGAAASQLVAQGVLTGGPVLLALLGGSPVEVTATFAALALFRAPYQVVLGALPQVTQQVTTHVASGQLDRLRSLARGLVGVTLVAVGLAALFGGLLGPSVLRLVFGSSVVVSSTVAAVVAAGCTLAVANVVLMVAALAGHGPLRVTAAWAVALAAGAVAVVLLAATSPVLRTSLVFLVTEVVAIAALALAAWTSLGLGSLRPGARQPA